MRLVQRGPAGCPLVLAWFIDTPLDPMMRATLPGCTILASAGRDLTPYLGALRALAPEATGPVVVVGWSRGCQSGRWLAIGHPDVIRAAVMLDGTSDALPIGGEQVDVWRSFADEARAGRKLFVAACSQMTYTERLARSPYAATRHVLEAAIGVALPAGTEVHEAGLHVYSVPSDTEATEPAAYVHRWIVQELLERVLRAHVAPWLAQFAPAAASAPSYLCATILDLARADVGLRERGGRNRGPEIDAAARAMGVPLGSEWCALLLTHRWIRPAAKMLGRARPAVGSVRAKDLMRQMIAAGTWVSAEEVRGGARVGPGWIYVMHRGAPGAPTGHTGIVERAGPDTWETIDANSGERSDEVARMVRRVDDPLLLGAGWVG